MHGVRLRRAMRGWSQRELDRRSGVSRSRLSFIERGLAMAKPQERRKLSGLLSEGIYGVRGKDSREGEANGSDSHRGAEGEWGN